MTDLRKLAQAVVDAGDRILFAAHCGDEDAQAEAEREHDAATAALEAALAPVPSEPTGMVAVRVLAALNNERGGLDGDEDE